MEFVDTSGQPRRTDDIEAALLWVKKGIVRPDFRDPEGVIHRVTIKDALEELLAIRQAMAKTKPPSDGPHAID